MRKTGCGTSIFAVLFMLAALRIGVPAATAAAPTPLKIMAIVHSDVDNFGNPSDTINFYDVTSIGAGGTNVFNTDSDEYSDPLFSAWIGYEALSGASGGFPAGNDEDPSAIAINYANGTVYMACYDSGNGLVNNPDEVGDNQGDWDLYRIDYQELLSDFVSNSRPKGTVYVTERQPITLANEQFMGDSADPLFDGVVDGFAHNIPHPDTLSPPTGQAARPSVVVESAIGKVGELARSPSNNIGTSFFDSELKFLDPETLLFMDTATNLTVAGDFQIREWKRVSTTPGLAVPDRDGLDDMENTFNPTNPVNDDNQIGGRNQTHEGQFETRESWEASIVGRFGLDEGETPPAGDLLGNASNPRGLAMVKRDGVLGVWFADSDLNDSGDDIAFYEIDLNSSPPTLTRRELSSSAGAPFPTKLAMADDPSVDTTTDDGVVDFLVVDKLGNLVIGESGYFDIDTNSTTPPTGDQGFTAIQPKIVTVEIADYQGTDSDSSGVNEIISGGTGFDDTAAYTTSANLNPTLTDDTEVLNNPDQIDDNADVAYDKGTGYIYFIDRDRDVGGFFEDIYVFDPATGTLVYSELDAVNPGFFNSGSQTIFLRGDVDDDGEITYADIKKLAAAIDDPTQGGQYSVAVGQEFLDLTGDNLLTAGDLIELVEDILGTALGDFDLNGMVDRDDLTLWESLYGGLLDGGDFLDWQRNFGFSNMAGSSVAVPEPATFLLFGLSAMLFAGGRCRASIPRF